MKIFIFIVTVLWIVVGIALVLEQGTKLRLKLDAQTDCTKSLLKERDSLLIIANEKRDSRLALHCEDFRIFKTVLSSDEKVIDVIYWDKAWNVYQSCQMTIRRRK